MAYRVVNCKGRSYSSQDFILRLGRCGREWEGKERFCGRTDVQVEELCLPWESWLVFQTQIQEGALLEHCLLAFEVPHCSCSWEIKKENDLTCLYIHKQSLDTNNQVPLFTQTKFEYKVARSFSYSVEIVIINHTYVAGIIYFLIRRKSRSVGKLSLV